MVLMHRPKETVGEGYRRRAARLQHAKLMGFFISERFNSRIKREEEDTA